jgi:hypothetical protein
MREKGPGAPTQRKYSQFFQVLRSSLGSGRSGKREFCLFAASCLATNQRPGTNGEQRFENR